MTHRSTAIDPRIGSTLDLLNVASVTNTDIDSVTRAVLSTNKIETGKTTAAELLAGAPVGKHGVTLLPPVDSPEIWAFGVTYMDLCENVKPKVDRLTYMPRFTMLIVQKRFF
ncbi:MAG: hypothetical protein CM1200mP39_11450 [Dehalococcoidia bacterium]|nr:MAG: hypothetical protein CM1200mP39_11450 [Dehalococcoidia bacterium]